MEEWWNGGMVEWRKEGMGSIPHVLIFFKPSLSIAIGMKSIDHTDTSLVDAL
jgi:hypothetical protein